MSNSGWWKNKKFPSLGESAVDCHWAQSALAEDVLENAWNDDRVLFDNSIEGVMQAKSMEEVAERFIALDRGDPGHGRVVFKAPQWRGDKSTRMMVVWPDGMLGLWYNDGDLEGRLITTDPELMKVGQVILEEAIGPKTSSGRAYVLMNTDEGPKLQSVGQAGVPLQRENYNPGVLDDFDAVVADLKSKDPSGRMAIFDGVPGTGKTYMIRGLLSAVPDALFVLVPAALIPELASPGMMNALLETRRNKGDLPTVFLIEDADECLAKRGDGSADVGAVSALLNLGDGIIGHMMDIRLICTTNLKTDELDEAVTRPGRLSKKIHVGPLDSIVSEYLYEKLTGKKIAIKEKLTLAEVYSLARGEGWKPVARRRSMGFSPQIEASGIMQHFINADELE